MNDEKVLKRVLSKPGDAASTPVEEGQGGGGPEEPQGVMTTGVVGGMKASVFTLVGDGIRRPAVSISKKLGEAETIMNEHLPMCRALRAILNPYLSPASCQELEEIFNDQGEGASDVEISGCMASAIHLRDGAERTRRFLQALIEGLEA